jgi:hypothetical protein
LTLIEFAESFNEVVEQDWLAFHIKGSATCDLRFLERRPFGLCLDSNEQGPGGVKMETSLECSTGVLRPELSKTNVVDTTVKVITKNA